MPDQVSVLLRKNLEKILQKWQTRAQKEISAAFYQSTLALRNSLPEYLTQMMEELSHSADRTRTQIEKSKDESTRVGKKHGRERGLFSAYSIDQLISEYHILRQTIFEVLEEEVELSKKSRDIILDSIEQAVNDAATEFSETSMQFREQLSATVTHDLQTPLTAAKLFAELIVKTPEAKTPEAAVNHAKNAHKIIQNLTRAEVMVHDLLDSNRVQAGQKLDLPFEQIDLIPLIADICEDLNVIYGNRIRIAPGPKVTGFWNGQALWRTLENIISNAFKYGSTSTEVNISITRSNELKGSVELSIHNDGNPIPPDEIGILFDSYTRSRTSKGTRGWGIGLHLVKGLIEAHHGRVWVESSQEKGTTFFIQIPIDARVPQTPSASPPTRH